MRPVIVEFPLTLPLIFLITPPPNGSKGSSRKSLNFNCKSKFELSPDTSKLPLAENDSFLSSFTTTSTS